MIHNSSSVRRALQLGRLLAMPQVRASILSWRLEQFCTLHDSSPTSSLTRLVFAAHDASVTVGSQCTLPRAPPRTLPAEWSLVPADLTLPPTHSSFSLRSQPPSTAHRRMQHPAVSTHSREYISVQRIHGVAIALSHECGRRSRWRRSTGHRIHIAG